MRSPWRLLAVVVCLTSAAPAIGGPAAPEEGPSPDMPSPTVGEVASEAPAATSSDDDQGDPEAAAKAARSLRWSDELETTLAHRALERTQTPEIQRFAQRILHDHALADAELVRICGELGIDLSPTAAEQQGRDEQVAEMLGELEDAGADFDAQFLRMMEDSHKASIRQLARLRREIESDDLRDLLTRVLPILDQHLVLARTLRGVPTPS